MQNLKTTAKDKVSKYLRRKTKVNATIKASHPDFRIVINKSNKYIKAQLLDKMGTVLAYVSDKDSNGETKSQKAQNAGQQLAKLIKEKNIEKVVFDRNGYLYHGRVKAFADGIREGGVSL